jgi:hypothetical protein
MPTETALAITDAVRAFTEETGEASVAVADLTPWMQHVRNGVHIDLTIGGWTATTTLSPEDVGLVPHDDEERASWERTLVLGQRILLPKEEFDTIKARRMRGRSILYDASTKVRGERFVPRGKYVATRDALQQAQAEYLAAWQDMDDRWNQLMSQVRREYSYIGSQNWLRFKDQGVTEVWGRPLGEELDYVGEFVARTMRRVPSRDHVRRLARFTWTKEILPVAKALENLQAGDQATPVTEPYDEMDADLEAARKDREAIMQELRDTAIEMQAALRAEVNKMAVDAIKALRGRKQKAPAVGRLETLVDYIEGMKFWKDADLERNVQQLKSLIATDPKDRSDAKIERTLRQLAAESALMLKQIDWPEVRSGREVDVPDDIVGLEEVVRSGRVAMEAETIGLIEPDEAPVRGASIMEAA